MYLRVASMNGCAYTAWGPCFCYGGKKCKSCATAEKIEGMGLDWDEEYSKAELNDFKDPEYIKTEAENES